MRRAVSTTLLTVLLAQPAWGAAGDGAVREEDVAATIRFLAAPELEGRHAAERGGAVASAFVAARLEALGWLPAGDETPAGRSWFQSVPAIEAAYDASSSSLAAAGGAGASARIEGSSGLFLVVPDRPDSAMAAGPLAFAGFGTRAPEYGHDDYEGLDVKEKIVLVLSGEPGETDPASKWNGTRPTRHATVAAKARLARSLGAAALLVVPNPAGRARAAADLLAGRKDDLNRPFIGLEDASSPLPVAYLDPSAAAAILSGTGLDLAAASRELEAGHGASRSLPERKVSLSLVFRDRRKLTLRNVVARLGAGKGLDGEAVVLGAHWDHLGAPGGILYPGADDNASGVAALLAAAAALKASPPEGASEVVIASWTGEEEGRLGSVAFLNRPPVPKERIRTVVNLDVLGRPNMDRADYARAIQVIYSAASPVLRDIAVAANEGLGLDLRFYGGLRFQPVSDHYTFFEAGIPIVYPFAGYIEDYHRPGDTVDKIDLRLVATSARFVARLVRLLAEHPGPIRLDPAIEVAPPPDPFERPAS
jgi:aminopeptidase YwaD